MKHSPDSHFYLKSLMIGIVPVATVLAISGCGDSGNERSISNLKGFSAIIKEAPSTSMLTLDESNAIKLVSLVLMSSPNLMDQQGVGSDLPFYVGKDENLKNPCPQGGFIELDKSSISFSHSKLSQTINKNKLSYSFSVNIDSCDLYKPEAPSEVVGDNKLSGLLNFSGAGEGESFSTKPSTTSETDFPFTLETSIKGEITSQVSKDQAPIKLQFTDFSLAYVTDRQRQDTLHQINLDPLGEEAKNAALKDFYMENLLCKGSMILDGTTYTCHEFVKSMLDVQFGDN